MKPALRVSDPATQASVDKLAELLSKLSLGDVDETLKQIKDSVSIIQAQSTISSGYLKTLVELVSDLSLKRLFKFKLMKLSMYFQLRGSSIDPIGIDGTYFRGYQFTKFSVLEGGTHTITNDDYSPIGINSAKLNFIVKCRSTISAGKEVTVEFVIDTGTHLMYKQYINIWDAVYPVPIEFLLYPRTFT